MNNAPEKPSHTQEGSLGITQALHQTDLALSPALLLTAWGKPLTPSEPQCPICKMGTIIAGLNMVIH